MKGLNLFTDFSKKAGTKLEPGKIKIDDTTLRDGEQTAGVVFANDEKIHIAKMLDKAGVHQIEAGIPTMVHSCGYEYELVKMCAEETDLIEHRVTQECPAGDYRRPCAQVAGVQTEHARRMALEALECCLASSKSAWTLSNFP